VERADRPRLARAEQTMRVRIARDKLRACELTGAINQLEREITVLVGRIAPQLLAEPGFGPLIGAKLVGEIAGAQRFATAAKLARAAGVAPIPPSSGNTQRQRLDQGGNRQINAALHRVIVTRARCHPETRDYIARRRSEGKAHPRGDPLPEALPRPPRLAAPSTAHPVREISQSLDIEATKGAAGGAVAPLSQWTEAPWIVSRNVSRARQIGPCARLVYTTKFGSIGPN
jgi:hypothetical protein